MKEIIIIQRLKDMKDMDILCVFKHKDEFYTKGITGEKIRANIVSGEPWLHKTFNFFALGLRGILIKLNLMEEKNGKPEAT